MQAVQAVQVVPTVRVAQTVLACRTFAAVAAKVASGGAGVHIGVGEDYGTKAARRHGTKAARQR